jgi:predicted DsbA family dithiol-disulfide isomerase
MPNIKDSVDFYWDPVCPWCWITSRWMEDVGRQKKIQVQWKLFSLKLINKNRDISENFRILHEIGLRALRVAAAVRRDYGNAGVAKVYAAMGALYHHDNEDIDEPSVLEQILQACSFPVQLSAAADDDSWDKDIQADMDQAIEKAGDDVGVPLIVLDGGKGPGFFGPVMSPAPTGEDAVKFWDAVIAAGGTPGFFELKRTREIGPIFGERPEI